MGVEWEKSGWKQVRKKEEGKERSLTNTRGLLAATVVSNWGTTTTTPPTSMRGNPNPPAAAVVAVVAKSPNSQLKNWERDFQGAFGGVKFGTIPTFVRLQFPRFVGRRGYHKAWESTVCLVHGNLFSVVCKMKKERKNNMVIIIKKERKKKGKGWLQYSDMYSPVCVCVCVGWLVDCRRCRHLKRHATIACKRPSHKIPQDERTNGRPAPSDKLMMMVGGWWRTKRAAAAQQNTSKKEKISKSIKWPRHRNNERNKEKTWWGPHKCGCITSFKVLFFLLLWHCHRLIAFTVDWVSGEIYKRLHSLLFLFDCFHHHPSYCIHLNTLLLQWRGSNQESDAVGRVTTSPNLLIINESSRRATNEKSSLSLSLIQSYDWNRTLEAIKSTENPITVPQTAKSLGLAKEKEAHQSFDVTNGSSQPEVQSSQRVFRISFLRLG